MKRIIIDVREPEEFQSNSIAGVINIPLNELMSGSSILASIPKDVQLIVFCRTGNRSEAALKFLKEQGFANVINGINRYNVEGILKSE